MGREEEADEVTEGNIVLLYDWRDAERVSLGLNFKPSCFTP